MSEKEIEDLLKKTSALRADRELAAGALARAAEGCAGLMKLIAHANSELQIKGCWILEIVLLNAPELLHTHRQLFLDLLPKITSGSAIRPVAKIIATWCSKVSSGKNNPYPLFSPQEPDLLSQYCFTWLLGDLPVAVKVYSMEALYHLGKGTSWIHPELHAYLTKHFPEQSPAFKARAKRLLKKL